MERLWLRVLRALETDGVGLGLFLGFLGLDGPADDAARFLVVVEEEEVVLGPGALEVDFCAFDLAAGRGAARLSV